MAPGDYEMMTPDRILDVQQEAYQVGLEAGKQERDRYKQALEQIINMEPFNQWRAWRMWEIARAAMLPSEVNDATR